MKKTILLLSSIFVLAGCTISGNSNTPSQNSTKTIYSDKASVTEGTLTLSFTELNEYKGFGSDTYSVSFTMNLLSTDPKPVEYKIASPKFIRESNNAEYSVNMLIMDPITINLECDIAKTYSFSTTLPTSIEAENYYFSFKGNSTNYKYCLYETPDELRTKFNVKFIVDGAEVETKQIPEGRKLAAYDWISSDYIYGCNEWYSDSNLTTKITDSFVVTANTSVYGQKKTILKYNTPDGINSAYVSGYNFVPSTGEIVVPKTYSGKSIYSILAGSFRDEVVGMKKIYIPKISSISNVQNFSNCSGLETVYFEGSETEWNSINEATFKSSVTFVFNTYK